MLNEQQLEELRYPTGRYQRPEQIDEVLIQQWKAEIAALPSDLKNVLASIPETYLDIPYREGGWSVRQITHHLADSHINSFIRFKWTLTEENPTIKPYLQDKWCAMQDALTAPLDWSLIILEGIHKRWIHILDSMAFSDYQRTFIHPDFQNMMKLDGVLGLYAWHGKHHLTQIIRFKEQHNI